MIGLRAVAYEVDGDKIGVMPDALDMTVTVPNTEVPTISMSYPANDLGIRGSLLDREIEVGIEITYDDRTWKEINGGRFISQQSDADLLGDGTDSRSLSATHVSTRLDEAYVWQVPNEAKDSDGKWNFKSVTAGVILRTLWDAAAARGWAPSLNLDITSSKDSSGNAWAKVVTLAFDKSVKLSSVVESLTNLGMIDVVWEGRTMHVYNADTTIATDVPANTFWPLAKGTSAAPESVKWSDICTHVLVKGDGDNAWYIENKEIAPGTRRREKIVEAGGVTLETTARMIAAATLASGAVPAEDVKREWSADDAILLPFLDYQVGQWMMVERRSGMERMRVAQVSLTLNQDGITGHTTFGTPLDDVLARLAKKTKGIVGAAAVAGNTVRENDGVDRRTIAKVTGVVADPGTTYFDHAWHSVVDVAWAAVEKATDGSEMTPDRYDVRYRLKRDNKPWVQGTSTDGSNTDARIENLIKGETYQVRVRAIKENVSTGAWSDPVDFVAVADTEPPPVPPAPTLTQALGVVEATWNGLSADGRAMPPDFNRIELAVGNDPTVADVYWAAMTEDRYRFIVAGLPKGTWYMRLRALDIEGNASAWSAASNITVTSSVDVDAITAEVKAGLDTNAIAQLAADRAEQLLDQRLSTVDKDIADARQDIRDQMTSLSESIATIAEALVVGGPYPPDTGEVGKTVWISPDARTFKMTKTGQ